MGKPNRKTCLSYCLLYRNQHNNPREEKTNEHKETIKSALNTVKETTQKLAEKRNLKIKDIVKIPEFQKLLVMEESVVEKMKASMTCKKSQFVIFI